MCRELCMNYRYPEFYKELNETCAANGGIGSFFVWGTIGLNTTDAHVTVGILNKENNELWQYETMAGYELENHEVRPTAPLCKFLKDRAKTTRPRVFFGDQTEQQADCVARCILFMRAWHAVCRNYGAAVAWAALQELAESRNPRPLRR